MKTTELIAAVGLAVQIPGMATPVILGTLILASVCVAAPTGGLQSDIQVRLRKPQAWIPFCTSAT